MFCSELFFSGFFSWLFDCNLFSFLLLTCSVKTLLVMKCACWIIITVNILQLSLLGKCLYSLKGTRRGAFYFWERSENWDRSVLMCSSSSMATKGRLLPNSLEKLLPYKECKWWLLSSLLSFLNSWLWSSASCRLGSVALISLISK